MKKFIFLFFFLGAALSSCSNDSEEFEIAAKELCSCMSDSDVDAEDAATVNMNIALCLLDSKVNLKDPEMTKAITKECPVHLFAFELFVEELK